MEIITTSELLKTRIKSLIAENKTIGFVPTMGALHDGHLSLIKCSVAENAVTVVSIFVNPTQFNDKNDLQKYPRDLNADIALIEPLGCDYIFAPSAEEIYTEDEMSQPFKFDFKGLDQVMEGKHRPGHFNGVVQVVSKLFYLVQPTKAYFGEKDFQQMTIIRHMTQQMGMPIEIVSCPITRDENGLALSSRNKLLREQQRKDAAHIHNVLAESVTFAFQTTVSELIEAVTNAVNARYDLKVEYFEIINADTLLPINSWQDAEAIIGCITVYCGTVRLIDNIRYK